MAGKSNMPLDHLDEERDVNSPADSIDAFGAARSTESQCVQSSQRDAISTSVRSSLTRHALNCRFVRHRAVSVPSLPAPHTPWRYEAPADRNPLRPNVTLPDSVCTVVGTPPVKMEFSMRFA